MTRDRLTRPLALARRLAPPPVPAAPRTAQKARTRPVAAIVRIRRPGAAEELGRLLEMATDWGPFELSAVVTRKSGAVCRFVYHGAEQTLAPAFADLLDCVRRVGPVAGAAVLGGPKLRAGSD